MSFTEGSANGALGGSGYVNGSPGQFFVAPTPATGARRIVSSISLFNNSAGALTATLTKYSGNPQTSVVLLKRSLAANETYVYSHPIVLFNSDGPGGQIADYLDGFDSANSGSSIQFDTTFADVT